jgi:hypothetical protein
MPTTDIQNEVKRLETLRQQADAEHQAKLADLHARQTAIEATKAPLSALLGRRAELCEQLSYANATRSNLVTASAEWQHFMDLCFRAQTGFTDYRGALRNKPDLATADAALRECVAHIGRQQVTLAGVEAEVRDYVSKNPSVAFMLPGDFPREAGN